MYDIVDLAAGQWIKLKARPDDRVDTREMTFWDAPRDKTGAARRTMYWGSCPLALGAYFSSAQ